MSAFVVDVDDPRQSRAFETKAAESTRVAEMTPMHARDVSGARRSGKPPHRQASPAAVSQEKD